MLKKIFLLIFIVLVLFSCKSKFQGLSERELNKALLKAIDANKIQDVKNIIKFGAKINFGSKTTDNPLAKALFSNKWKIADLLVEQGADINYKVSLHCLVPIMVSAVAFDRPDIVRYLISKGANVNEKTEKGSNAILNASCQNKLESAKILLEKNADISIRDNDGKTPLTIAAEKGNKEIVALLLSNGVDINQIGFKDKTALDLAKEKNNKDIIAMLEKQANK